LTGRVIADAGPLIALARIDRLELLHRLYGVVLLPPAVVTELRLAEQRPGASPLAAALAAGWLEVAHPSNTESLRKLHLLLDPGEAEVIELAVQRGCRFALLDDRRGRAAAHRWKVPVAGTGAVLLAAKAAGWIPAIAPVLEALCAARYRLAPTLVEALLHKAQEQTSP